MTLIGLKRGSPKKRIPQFAERLSKSAFPVYESISFPNKNRGYNFDRSRYDYRTTFSSYT